MPSKTLNSVHAFHHDEVHLSGDQDAIFEYESEHHDSCFNVDWRGEFDEILSEVNSRLPNGEVTVETSGKAAMLVCGAKRAKVAEYDLLVLLQAINRVIASENMQLRVFADSLDSDTYGVMIKPAEWWKSMDKEFKSEFTPAFVRPKDVQA